MHILIKISDGIIFICIGNSCRSAMAEGYLTSIKSKDAQILVDSFGISPAKKVNPKAVKVMAEIGIDISGHKPKGLDMASINKGDHVICLSESVFNRLPSLIRNQSVIWEIDDPWGKSVENYRQTRDKLIRKINDFHQECV